MAYRRVFLSVIALSLVICFIYPLTNLWLDIKYYKFEGFFIYCFLSSVVSVVINVCLSLIFFRRLT